MADFSGNYWGRPFHNAYFQAWTEIGLGGLLVFVAMLMTQATMLAFAAFSAPHALRTLVRGTLLALLGIMGLMMSEPMLDHSNTWLMLALAQAVIAAAARPAAAVASGRAL